MSLKAPTPGQPGYQEWRDLADAVDAAGVLGAGVADAEWNPMESAPKDGTEVELLLHHPNRQYATEAEKHRWTQIVRAKWIDFNGGGWTWSGMYGLPQGWRPSGAASSYGSQKC